MPLDFPDGCRCFVDANVLYYHFVQTPDVSTACTAFLRRVQSGAVTAYSSAGNLADCIHKIMLAEVASRFSLTRAGLATWLQRNADRIPDLSWHQDAARELPVLRVELLPVDHTIIMAAAGISRTERLLTNDAIILALMRQYGITDLATNDDDFRSVPNITVRNPRP